MRKRCSRCGETKPIGEFHRARQNRDGYCGRCKTCCAAQYKEWYVVHRERETARSRKYYNDNREKENTRSRKYRENNQEKLAAYMQKWQRANPERCRESCRNRYAQRQGATGSFTTKEFQALCKKAGNKCLCCGSPGPLEADHIIPLSKGGSNSIENIQPLCRSCSASKRTKETNYWESVI